MLVADIREHFSRTLRSLMDRDNITQEVLAAAIGKSQVSISRYLSKDIFPRPEILEKIAQFFHVNVAFLTGWPAGDPIPQEALDLYERIQKLAPDSPARKAIDALLGIENDSQDTKENNQT